MEKDIKFYEYHSMICHTVTNPARLQIIELIGKGKLNVSEIQKKTNLSMSSLSNHLGSLFKIGVLKREKSGTFTYYYLSNLELLKIIEKMSEFVMSIAKQKFGPF
ncbi:MAG: metalloregulator ArsR/SmtB family transcription factor [Acidobacteriota bacterium]